MSELYLVLNEIFFLCNQKFIRFKAKQTLTTAKTILFLKFQEPITYAIEHISTSNTTKHPPPQSHKNRTACTSPIYLIHKTYNMTFCQTGNKRLL